MSTTPQDPHDQPVTPDSQPAPPVKKTSTEPMGALAAPAAGATPAVSTRPAWLLPALTGVIGLIIGSAGTAVVTGQRAAAADRAEASASASSASASAKAEADAAASLAAVLTDASETCGTTHVSGMKLADGGTSLTFDMKGEEDTRGADLTTIMCVFDELKMPSAVLSHIEQTTSMDGRQSETWDNLTVSWSYHPDRGLDGVLTVAEK
jgi:hypothetical protein